jgi:hypothetical protein
LFQKKVGNNFERDLALPVDRGRYILGAVSCPLNCVLPVWCPYFSIDTGGSSGHGFYMKQQKYKMLSFFLEFNVFCKKSIGSPVPSI